MDVVLYIFDILMCILWMLTYTLVLIATLKYQYPMIAIYSQVLLAPLELVCAIFFIRANKGLTFFSFCYAYWVLAEIIIFIVACRMGYVSRRKVIVSITSACIVTVALYCFVIILDQMLTTNYCVTFLAEIIWLQYVLNKQYPAKPIILTAFVLKLLADAMIVPVYYGVGTWYTNVLVVALPVLDAAYIYAYLIKKYSERTYAKKQKSRTGYR